MCVCGASTFFLESLVTSKQPSCSYFVREGGLSLGTLTTTDPNTPEGPFCHLMKSSSTAGEGPWYKSYGWLDLRGFIDVTRRRGPCWPPRPAGLRSLGVYLDTAVVGYHPVLVDPGVAGGTRQARVFYKAPFLRGELVRRCRLT